MNPAIPKAPNEYKLEKNKASDLLFLNVFEAPGGIFQKTSSKIKMFSPSMIMFFRLLINWTMKLSNK